MLPEPAATASALAYTEETDAAMQAAQLLQVRSG
jgi:hypothetical protein